VRFGTAAGSGWEVVGTDDTTFSLERPAYGTAVSTPLIAGGHITGVDENIRVWIRSGDEPAPAPATVLATVPAGGDRAPWSTVPMSFAQTGVLTVVASTGGHLQQVERFAVMGVHTG